MYINITTKIRGNRNYLTTDMFQDQVRIISM